MVYMFDVVHVVSQLHFVPFWLLYNLVQAQVSTTSYSKTAVLSRLMQTLAL